MNRSNELSFNEEAEDCRRKALAYLGRPEGPFLLRVARAFDDSCGGSSEVCCGSESRLRLAAGMGERLPFNCASTSG